MHLKTLLSLIQLKFESIATTLICHVDLRRSSNVDLRNFIPNCFFCGEADCEEKLHKCETFAVNQKVRNIAHELGDTTIMAKLSEGDMIATEAMYHVKCWVNYCNRCRHKQLTLPGEDNNGTLAIMNGMS